MRELPRGPEAFEMVLAEKPCDQAYPTWIGLCDERDLRDPYAQYQVHRRAFATARCSAPLRVALARVAAAVVSKQPWKELGWVRLGDYTRERHGISPRELQELGRVGAKLAELPKLEQALLDARLTWSKVRLIAGVATPEDEEEWIPLGRRLSYWGLGDHIRKQQSSEDAPAPDPTGEEEDETVQFRIACSSPVRRQWHQTRRLASAVAGHPVSAAECIDMLTAEASSALPPDPDAPKKFPDPPESGSRFVLHQSVPPVEDVAQMTRDKYEPEPVTCLPGFLQELVDGLDDLPARELDRRFGACLHYEQLVDTQLGSLLGIVSRVGIHLTFELPSASRYAQELLGLSQRKAQRLLRIEHALREGPALARAYRSGELSWVQADLLVPLFAAGLGRWGEQWVERARTVTVRQLADDVEDALLVLDTDRPLWARTGGLPHKLEAEPDRTGGTTTCARSTIGFRAEPELVQAFWVMLCTIRRRIEGVTGRWSRAEDAFAVMMQHAAEAWGADKKVSKAFRIYQRDGWRCMVPGCTSRRNLHVHHIVPRSHGGGDEDMNLVTLCVSHHLRGVHGGIVAIRGKAPDELMFELGTGRNRRPFAVYRSGDIVVRAPGRE